MEGALLLTDLLPAWPCACSAGSGSGRCGAIDSEVPVATREIQRRNNQEESCPSVNAVREAYEARRGLDTATGNMTDPKTAEVAVRHWVDQAPHAGARGQPFRSGVVVLCVHRDVSCGLRCPVTPVKGGRAAPVRSGDGAGSAQEPGPAQDQTGPGSKKALA
jgi:hypothetical protein